MRQPQIGDVVEMTYPKEMFGGRFAGERGTVKGIQPQFNAPALFTIHLAAADLSSAEVKACYPDDFKIISKSNAPRR